MLLALFLMGAAIVGRLFSLQIINGEYYKKVAGEQHEFTRELANDRGEIFIHDKDDLLLVAGNRKWPMVYLVPKDVENSEEVAVKLSEILGLERETILEKINKEGDPYEPLKHRINDEEVEGINALDFKGVGIINEDLRYYPLGSGLAHVIGFWGFGGDERAGQYGVESFYERELKGEAGEVVGEKDAFGRIVGVAHRFISPPMPSKSLVLTIDKNIQFMAEEKLRGLIEKWEAESGSVIVMEPSTGDIIALANFPDFDLNEYSKVSDIELFLNKAIQGVFEPGSVFKPITMAAALDDGKVTPGTSYFDEGFVKIGGYTIKNSDEKKHGWQTMTEVLEKSLNTGVIFAQKLLDDDVFVRYAREFGFSSKTGIDLPGEVSGNISNLYFGREINYATASFGQGIAVTPIELISSISAIANRGVMMQPRVVDSFLDNNGRIAEIEPSKIRRVISSETAQSLTKMLVSAVENGYGKSIRIPGYYIAGKTGTAQVPKKDGRGYGEETIHTFVGYAPAFNPRFVVMIKIDNPQGIRFAADSIGPTFRQFTEFMINYYGIAPDYTP